MEALKTLTTDALYPNVPAVAGGSTVGFDVLIGIGWPDDTELLQTLTAGNAFIGIFPLDGERNTTVWEYAEQEVPRPPPGISAAYDFDTATLTFAGVANAGDVFGIAFAGTGYTLAFTAGQTAAQCAAFVAASVGAAYVLASAVLFGGAPVTFGGALVTFGAIQHVIANGPVIDLQGGITPQIATGNNGQTMRNVGSIERRIQLQMWTFDQPSRDTLFAALIAVVQDTQFLLIPAPNSAAIEAARLSYSSSTWSDKPQNAGGYARAMIVLVDFQTTIYQTAYQILFAGLNLNNVHYGPL